MLASRRGRVEHGTHNVANAEKIRTVVMRMHVLQLKEIYIRNIMLPVRLSLQEHKLQKDSPKHFSNAATHMAYTVGVSFARRRTGSLVIDGRCVSSSICRCELNGPGNCMCTFSQRSEDKP